MGTWGSGNLDSDSALDAVDDVMDTLVTKISEWVDHEEFDVDDGHEQAMALFEIMLTLAREANATPPKEKIIAAWKERVLNVYDERIDALDPGPDYKVERRKIIEKTFDDLLECSRKIWKE